MGADRSWTAVRSGRLSPRARHLACHSVRARLGGDVGDGPGHVVCGRATSSTRKPLIGAGPRGPNVSGDRVAGALGLHRDRDVAWPSALPVGERSSARPTQAGGPCLLVVVIPRRTSFTVGPTTSVTTPGTVGGCSVQRPHCSGPGAPHTLPHPDQAGCTGRRRNAGFAPTCAPTHHGGPALPVLSAGAVVA
jgi:hypothetical protein